MRRWTTLGVLLALGCQTDGERGAAYVGREACVSCHVEVVDAYRGSDHDLALEVASPETVLGDFSDTPLVQSGATYTFRRDGDRFLITVEEADGGVQELEVRYAVGHYPLQQYLVESVGGRLQRLPVSWDARPASEGGGRWFHVYGDTQIPTDDALHWSKPSQNWNLMCAACHSVNVEKGYDPETRSYETTWSEPDVSCEACHGPASRHLAWAEGNQNGSLDALGSTGFAARLSASAGGAWALEGDSTARRLAAPVASWEYDVCAACHSHRAPLAAYEPGTRYLDAFSLSSLRAPLYYADGQVREEVFVYGSFLQSRMHAAGVRCGDCHDPHSLELRADGNALCSDCHAPTVFDVRRHSFHESAGGAVGCVDCHMPTTTFMQVDRRRDHSFRTPRPRLPDAPNACLACHEGRSTSWVVETLDGWYGSGDVDAPARAAVVLAAAERGDPTVVTELLRVAGDTTLAAVMRATAYGFLSQYPSAASLAALTRATSDGSALVRREAARALTFLPPEERLPSLLPLLRDPARAVRLAAARSSASISLADLPGPTRDLLEQGFTEYEESMRRRLDEPSANVELGDYLAERGVDGEAVARYEEALALEAAFVPAYVNLADFYRLHGRETEALDVIQAGLAVDPESAVLQYSLGLWHVRDGNLQRASAELAGAVEREPDDARMVTAYALVLEGTGRSATAAAALESLVARRPVDADVVLTLIAIYRRQGQDAEALRHARKLAGLYAADARFSELVDEIEATIANRDVNGVR